MQVRYVWLLLVLLCLSFATAQSSRNQEREPRSSQTLITLSAPLSQTQFNELLERAQVLLRGAEFANKLTLETLVSFQEGPFEGNPFRTDKAVEPMLLRSASTTGVSNTVALCSGVMGVISTSVDRPLTAKELAQLSAALEEILGPDVAYGVDGQNDHDDHHAAGVFAEKLKW